jgi:TonB family protein
MNRVQKKCMAFSLGLHGLLGIILIASAGFGTHSQPADAQIMTMIPANIVDRPGAGGETAAVNAMPAPTPPVANSAPVAPPHAQQAQHEPVTQATRPPARANKEVEPPEPDKAEHAEAELKPGKTPKHHEIVPSYEPASAAVSKKQKGKTSSTDTASTARDDARRLGAIAKSLGQLASNVSGSGNPNIVSTGGIGGGEAYAGYNDAVISIYYHAWITPDSTASRLSSAYADVTVARDGSVISAELVVSSKDRTLDKSVERTLRQVTKLPPFPASSSDTQRTFKLRFNLEAKDKEMSG